MEHKGKPLRWYPLSPDVPELVRQHRITEANAYAEEIKKRQQERDK